MLPRGYDNFSGQRPEPRRSSVARSFGWARPCGRVRRFNLAPGRGGSAGCGGLTGRAHLAVCGGSTGVRARPFSTAWWFGWTRRSAGARRFTWVSGAVVRLNAPPTGARRFNWASLGAVVPVDAPIRRRAAIQVGVRCGGSDGRARSAACSGSMGCLGAAVGGVGWGDLAGALIWRRVAVWPGAAVRWRAAADLGGWARRLSGPRRFGQTRLIGGAQRFNWARRLSGARGFGQTRPIGGSRRFNWARRFSEARGFGQTCRSAGRRFRGARRLSGARRFGGVRRFSAGAATWPDARIPGCTAVRLGALPASVCALRIARWRTGTPGGAHDQ